MAILTLSINDDGSPVEHSLDQLIHKFNEDGQFVDFETSSMLKLSVGQASTIGLVSFESIEPSRMASQVGLLHMNLDELPIGGQTTITMMKP